MANLNECDHIITIGYLKSFIGTEIHSSDNDSILSVNNDDDTYCPTYAELTGGTLIQNWSQGSTPNGDRDGIVVGGSYANNQCVREGDLSMKYTRFQSFTISASTTSISSCSGASSLSFSHLYTRYTKSHTNDCETATTTPTTDVSDTELSEVTYTSSNNVFSINKPTVSVGKNNPNGNGRAERRDTIITGSITFRNHQHTDTVGITQNALDGYYSWDNHRTGQSEVYYDSFKITANTFDCAGGTAKGTGYYHYVNWHINEWKDDCGTIYPLDTSASTYTNDNRTESWSKIIDPIDCSTLTRDYSHTETEYWHGYSDTWTQNCKKCSGCHTITPTEGGCNPTPTFTATTISN